MINVQALIGTMLGNCTLQKLIGQGAMSAVFLAQQATPSRQVVVKVVAPPPSQSASQRTVFLERFRQEIPTVAALKHQNILPVYEYGEQDGLAYLVMPYISGETLQEVLKQEGSLSFSKAADYLNQLATALDFAHQQGVVHRNLSPAKVLKTHDGRLLLTDFGLASIVAERQTSQMPLLNSETPAGTLEYMAPEQVMGDVVDARTDLYALGIILYRMITGKTPFQDGSPMQVATQLVQESPPSPRSLRAELSLAAEQVMVHAIAKRPADRYTCAQDFANEFRVALATGSTTRVLSISSAISGDTSAKKIAATAGLPVIPATPATPAAALRSQELFSPTGEKVQETGKTSEDKTQSKSRPISLLPLEETTSSSADRNTPLPPVRPRLGLRTSLLGPMDDTPPSLAEPKVNEESTAAATGQLPFSFTPPVTKPQESQSISLVMPVPPVSSANTTRTLSVSQSEPDNADVMSSPKPGVPDPLSPFPALQTTGAVTLPGSELGNTGMMKLTGAVKIVQVPVAGQPGRYVTGFLPVLPQAPQTQQLQGPAVATEHTQKWSLKKWQKITALALVVLIILSVSGAWLFRSRPAQRQSTQIGARTHLVTADLHATTIARATATAIANIILTDPLNQNIHNWPVSSSGYKIYLFKDGAYHITNNDPRQSAPALLGGVDIKGPMVYTLTMQEIKGNDNSINNSFGLIFRFSSKTAASKTHTTFYTFQVVNTKGGEYQFSKYDDGKGSSVDPYTLLWYRTFGKEFHQGKGPGNSNTVKIIAYGKSFTLFVNGQQVGTVQDGSLPEGEVGMLVNLKGTEVAFSNLLLTYS